MERIVVGTSENILAEFANSASAYPFTVFEMYDGEPVAIEGFATKEAAQASVKEAIAYGVKVEFYW